MKLVADSFFKLPFLPAHWTLLLDLLRVQPFEDAVHVETVGALAPDKWTVIPGNLTCNILEPAFDHFNCTTLEHTYGQLYIYKVIN